MCTGESSAFIHILTVLCHAGILIGLIMKYAGDSVDTTPMSCNSDKNMTSPPKTVFLEVKNETYAFELKNKIFEDDEGSTYESLVS